MSDSPAPRPSRLHELVLMLCVAWLMMQNVILFTLIAWQPLTGLRIATLVLLRVALHAATPVTVLSGSGLLDVATLMATGTGTHHV